MEHEPRDSLTTWSLLVRKGSEGGREREKEAENETEKGEHGGVGEREKKGERADMWRCSIKKGSLHMRTESLYSPITVI